MKKAIADFFGKHQGRILQIMLGAIMVLFIGILIATYIVSKRANPVFLDEKGRPVETQSETRSY